MDPFEKLLARQSELTSAKWGLNLTLMETVAYISTEWIFQTEKQFHTDKINASRLLRFTNHFSSQVVQRNFNLWRHRPRNFPTASRYKELCRQSAIPTCPMYHRYPYVSFADFSEERIRGDRRGTSNKHTCSRDIEGQQRKESVVSNKRISRSISSCEVRKVS